MEKATFSERLNLIIKEKNIRQIELCQKTGIGKSAMSQYLGGAFEPKQQNLYALAKALEVSEAWLMGYDVPKTRITDPVIADSPDYYATSISGYTDTFYFKASDDSMLNAHIPAGAFVLVQKQEIIESGAIVHYSFADSAPSLRRYHKVDDMILLIPENPHFTPHVCHSIDVDNGILKINGIVKRIIIET